MYTYLHAASATSLKNTHVPPFKQNALPITGHGCPACVQLFGGGELYPRIKWNEHCECELIGVNQILYGMKSSS